MAQLKDSLITGDLRVTGTIYGDANLGSLNASGTGLGTDGQILTSTGTGLAWSSNVTPSSHTHGQITNDGKIVNNTTITSSDSIVYSDASNSGILKKDSAVNTANALMNALTTGGSVLTANDYVITQYVGGGTTTTTYHRRPASAIRVGGLLTARKLKVALGSTTDATFDGTADQTSIPISGTLGIANGGTGAITAEAAWTALGGGASGKHADSYFALAGHNHDATYVNITGDTMTNYLTIKHASAAKLVTEDTTSTGKVFYGFGSAHQNHGIYSYGYAPTQSSWTTDEKWMVYRNSSGDIILNGNATTATTASNLTNFKVTTSTNLWAVDSPTTNAIGYQSGLTKATWNYQQADGAIYDQFYNSNWIHQIYGDYRTGQISVRGKNNGTWQSWRRILDETNGATILGLGTLATKSTISNHSVTTPTGATSRTADVALNTTTVNSITAVGTLPSLTVTATDVVTGGTTTAIPNISKKTVVTGVTKKTVVTGGSTTAVPNISKKTVVTSATAAKATYSSGVLTISDGSVTTGDSVTVGTAINAYTSLTTGDSVTVTTGDSVTVGTAINAYTALTTSSIGSASDWSAGTLPTKGSNTTVATSVKTQPTFTVTTQTTTLSHTVS